PFTKVLWPMRFSISGLLTLTTVVAIEQCFDAVRIFGILLPGVLLLIGLPVASKLSKPRSDDGDRSEPLIDRFWELLFWSFVNAAIVICIMEASEH
ncbi:hypothetical protein N9B45_01650, partial [bacterium]|nr:hypothetical protein [bacterium]